MTHRSQASGATEAGGMGRALRIGRVLALVAIALTTMAQQDPCSDFGQGFEEGAREPGSGAGAGMTIDNSNLDKVFDANGEGYEGASVRLVGQVYDREGDLLLVWGDHENIEKPLQVTGKTEGISSDDLVLVTGTLTGGGSYTTVMGGNEETLDIDATSVKEISEEKASRLANPTTYEVAFDASQRKAGFTVAVKSMSWTDDSTRVAIEASNESKDTVTLSASDAALKQGSRQYDQSFEQMEGSSEFDSGIRPGVTKEATLVFERVKRRPARVELELEWYSDDIDILDPKPFRFRLTW